MRRVIRGRVGPEGDCAIPIDVRIGRVWRRQHAIVDTGFHGHLSIPLHFVRRARFRRVAFESYQLADGRVVRQPVFMVDLRFGGRRRTEPAVATRSGEWLVGTGLLRGQVLRIDFARGRVDIRPA